ncbi:MAG TPA: hypothetical protein VEF06_12955 [Bryobacteraceae bacterium]|nr:hypothetical protein [Bryobacteraceae bacterium]
MPERINKLQPDRTLYLRGFNTFAAAASIHDASPTGFTISGTFRDPADFAVAVLYDADNYFEHPSIKYLPDFNLSGLTLSFDLNYSDGVQPIDSPKFNWIDWATLDCALANGSTASIPLFNNAMLVDPAFPAATGAFNLTSTSTVQPFDRVTLWYLNTAFDYIAPGTNPTSAQFSFFAGTVGAVHSITINGATYSYTEVSGDTGATVASALISAVNSAPDPWCVAATGAASNEVLLTVRPGQEGNNIALSASDGNASVTIYQSSTTIAAAALAAQINQTSNWTTINSVHALMATASGSRIQITAARYGTVNVSGTEVTLVSGAPFGGITAGATILLAGAGYTVANVQSPTALTLTSSATSGSNVLYVAPRGGRDGNMIQMYALSKTSTLSAAQSTVQFSGGSSAVTWNCTIDFTALGIDQLRQCWLTFAPSLSNGAAWTPTEWQAAFSNWTLSGDPDVMKLQVAGPGSVRLEENDAACACTGTWTLDDSSSNFYSKYFAVATNDTTATLTVTWTCQFTHNVYVGTSLYSDRAIMNVTIDGVAQPALNCILNTDSAIVTRRLIASNIAPGTHTVVFTMQQAGYFYFDFLEAAVLSDVPDAFAPRTNVSPALDFDTDHSYKLPPARILWIFDQLGYAGPMNEYLGVFWWNERTATGIVYSTARITFSGTFAGGDSIILNLNGTAIGKSVFPADTLSTIAGHFAAFINETFVGSWASASGAVLTITGRSPASNYTVALSAPQVTSSAGQATITEAPAAGSYSPASYVVDDSANPPINRATRDWHADFYAQCASRSREVVTSCSMELVYPPSGYSACFPDGTPVTTATGFGSISSTQCAVGNTNLLAYQKAVYRNIARMQSTAGLTPCVQYGEFLWWFDAEPGVGMACYDSQTTAAAQAALGRPLHVFLTPNDDPSINSSADATFLRNRLRDHVAALVADIQNAYPTAICEVLWPYDVNYPSVLNDNGSPLGGQLNYFVNLPVEWQQPSTAPFARIKAEALAFATGMRSLSLAAEAIQLFPGFGWSLNDVRYLVPVFGQAIPWVRELSLCWAAGIKAVNFWAFDHICLFNLQVPEGILERRSFVKRA